MIWFQSVRIELMNWLIDWLTGTGREESRKSIDLGQPDLALQDDIIDEVSSDVFKVFTYFHPHYSKTRDTFQVDWQVSVVNFAWIESVISLHDVFYQTLFYLSLCT